MKQFVVITCLVVTMVVAVRKEVTSINIFFTKIIILINIFLVKIAVVIQNHRQDHHLDQHSCQDHDCDLHHDLGGADGRGQNELELGVQR